MMTALILGLLFVAGVWVLGSANRAAMEDRILAQARIEAAKVARLTVDADALEFARIEAERTAKVVAKRVAEAECCALANVVRAQLSRRGVALPSEN